MPEKLNKERILILLAEADTKWYQSHAGPFNYREHLDFTAEYISKNYKKGARKIST